jgi:hypothetical protein
MERLDEGAAPKSCRNCATLLRGPYCFACGQKDEPLEQSLWQLGRELFRHPLVDTRLWRTLARLLFRPGFLTAEHNLGRRAAYVRPVKLYFTVSIAFFATVALVAPEGVLRPPPPAATAVGAPKPTVFGMSWWPAMERRLQSNVDAMSAEGYGHFYAALNKRITDLFPKTLFFLVPLGALLLKLFWFRRPYAGHFVFALHVHAFLFALLLLALLPWPMVGWAVTVLTVSYFVLAVRRVYGDGWPRTMVKGAGVLVGYAVVLYLVIFVNTMLAILRA